MADIGKSDAIAAAQRMSEAISAIVYASPENSFESIIESNRENFRGLRVICASKAAKLNKTSISLREIESLCPLFTSFFDGNALFFYTDDIYRATMEGTAQITLDFSVILDKNIAEAFRCFSIGKGVSKPTDIYKLLVLLKGSGAENLNFSYLAYLTEEYEHFGDTKNSRPIRTLTALKLLDHICPDALAVSPGKPKFLCSYQDAEAEAKETLSLFSESGQMEVLQTRRLATYAMLLKAMLLRWSPSFTISGALNELLAFSVQRIGKFAKQEIYFGWKLMGGVGLVPKFFLPIQVPSTNALSHLKGISWDISLLRSLKVHFALQRSVGDKKCDFFVPMLASLDKSFKLLVDACPLKAVVMSDAANSISLIFHDELQFQEALNIAMDSKNRGDLNNPDARYVRQQNGFDGIRLRAIVSALEVEVQKRTGELSKGHSNN